MTCSNCGADIPAGARFCANCGTPVGEASPTQERRLVSVLFADLTDSTRLTTRLDIERVREILAAFYQEVSDELQALRGRAEKFIGDAVMAVFGLPIAHEDDALRAVRAAVGIRYRARRLGERLGLDEGELEVRVGIQTGDVAVGTAAGGQIFVAGPTVNAAARLQAAAAPGEILVGDVTHELTRSSVVYADRRDFEAKGFDEPLHAYPLQSLTMRSARRTIPLVGRRTEMTLLRDMLDRVVTTGRPHLVTLLGEPGIGKTRLVEELIAGLADPVRAMVGEVQPADWGPSFSPVIEMLYRLAGLDRTADAEEILSKLDPILGDDPDARRLREQLGAALRGSAPERDESTFVSEVQSGFIGLVNRLTLAGPVVLAFDAVEHASQPLLELIERLAARSTTGPRPVMVIAAGRGEIEQTGRPWGTRAENHTTLRLAPLTDAESVELVQQSGAGRITEQTAQQIASRAGGNPFFIVEMTGMLLASRRTDVFYGLTTLPPTVQAVVAARLDRLPTALRELARRTSVFVYSFDLLELALVSDGTEEQLRALEDAEVLVRLDGPTIRWRFRHQTLRDVAYETLTKRERLRLHLQVADGLIAAGRDQSYVADHLERAARASLDLDPTDRALARRAAGALAEAGDQARRRMESRRAIERYERALALIGPDDDLATIEAPIYAGIGEARYWLGEYDAAIKALERAEQLAVEIKDDSILAAALRFRGDIVLNTDGDIDEAQRIFDRALEAAERSGDVRALARTLLFAGWVPWNRDDFDAANKVWERALELARANGDRWAQVRALSSLSVSTSMQEELEVSGELARQAMELATELGDRFSMAVATVQVGRSLLETNKAEESLGYFTEAIAVFDELGARWEYADALRTRGVALRELGRLNEAETDLLAALKVLEQLGERSLTRWTWLALARVAEKRGDKVAATERRKRAEEVPAPIG